MWLLLKGFYATGAAIIWNFATWYRGLPASSSHSLIGSIMGVGMGVALCLGIGTMWANKSGIQPETVRETALAGVLTLPVAMALSGGLYWLSTLVTG